ncbi:TPA: hypothetical protein EYP70_06880 [Candidatus Bathyarchaeota archaeon]|nr:hypothetical protein [Candidatus Bathyarchaeota archaeon]
MTSKSEVNELIFGRLKNGDVLGFEKIIEICDSKGMRSNFFIDVCEVEKYGHNTWQNICHTIKEQGHEVELHTHPRRFYNHGREHLWEYSLSEQVEILKYGRKLIKEWTGENPVAHRAGAYGINEDTFVALRENEIPIDSSSFYGHPNCKAVVTKNKIVEHNGIVEIPVTVLRRVRRVKLGNWVLKQQLSFVKTDIDWANLDELKSFVQQAKGNNVKVMTLFLHSYSLLKYDRSFTHFEPDWNDIEKLNKFLNFVANDPEIKVITMREFYEMYQQNPEQFIGSDYVPVIEYNEQFNPIKYGARRAKSNIRRLVQSSLKLIFGGNCRKL